ncbi:MAG TPA: OB-fold domain-containing protein, partial [Caulobacteraceae bacterium]|nr:OB-fold domain-containing protein [Caulobacteraceae bacterium]
GMTDLPLPEITSLNARYWGALEGGELVFQACGCGARWLPARPECPNCLAADGWSWSPSSGRGRLVSWVVYHAAYHPAFADRVPYNVAIVELEEGPRLITNIEAANESLRPDMPVRLAVARENGFAIARFRPR